MIFLSVDGRDLLYAKSKTNVNVDTWKDAFYFYAETNPLGVIGSFISDNYKKLPDYYRYKHRFFLYALDCEVMYQILLAMSEQKDVQLKMYDLHSDNLEFTVHLMKLYISTQNGRQYLLAWDDVRNRPWFYRLDNIIKIKIQDRIDKEDTFTVQENYEKNTRT